MALLTLCHWLSGTSTSRIAVNDIAEVDATGRYITIPLGVQMAYQNHHAHLYWVLYTIGVGVTLACLLL